MRNFFTRLSQGWIRPIRVGWFLAYRQILRGSKWTTILIISIMVLTFLNLVVVTGLLVGLISGSYAQFRESYSGDVYITPKPGRKYIENSQELIKYLQAHSSVIAVSPRYSTTASLLGTLDALPEPKEKANQAGVALMGIDPVQEEMVTGFSQFVIEGEPLETDEQGYLLIGANLLKEYSSFADVDIPGLDLLEGVGVGSRVRLTIADGEGEKKKDYVVRGILKTKVDQISQRVFMVDKDLRKLLSSNQWEVQEIAVKVVPGMDAALVQELRDRVGNSPVRVQTSFEAIPAFLRDIETTMNILGNALSSFALVVALITVFIVIFINAVTRRKFIGILKGIGIEPRVIQFSYVFQALFYALVGSSVGLLLTFGFLRPYFANNPIDFPFSDGILVATVSGSLLRVGILLFVTLLAGFVPATLIVRRNTLDSILGR
jgi:putative ABC transport system permease protein